jgi:hypothetical protein
MVLFLPPDHGFIFNRKLLLAQYCRRIKYRQSTVWPTYTPTGSIVEIKIADLSDTLGWRCPIKNLDTVRLKRDGIRFDSLNFRGSSRICCQDFTESGADRIYGSGGGLSEHMFELGKKPIRLGSGRASILAGRTVWRRRNE